MSIAAHQARLGPLNLKTSEEMRLQRLARERDPQRGSQQLVVPIPDRAEPAEFLVGFLRELVPDMTTDMTSGS